jgi:hypothetical protein
MALLGALVQYLLAGGVRLIVASEPAKPKAEDSRMDHNQNLDQQSPHDALDAPKAQEAVAPGGSSSGDNLAKQEAAQPPNTSRGEETTFRQFFLGPNLSLVIAAVLKGIIAFLVAIVMKDATILGITVQRGNFDGFFTLGFLFGFWPIAELWLALAKRAGTANS